MVRYSKKYEGALVSGVESLLGFLFDLCDGFVIKKFDRKKAFQDIKSGSNSPLSDQKISKMFYDLKRQKYIETDNTDSEHSIKLTNKAKIRIIEKIVEQQKNDKKFRFVSFDVPERLHYQRDLFRRTIKRMGFRQVQQSLWVTDKNIGDLVELAAEEYKVSDYVAYIVSETSNINHHVEETLVKESSN